MRTSRRLPAVKSWKSFESSLVLALASLNDGEFLVIGRKGTRRYVQFAAEEGCSMRVESVSNSYLDEDERLSDMDCSALVELGWRPPTISPDHDPLAHGTPESPNFYLDLDAPVPLLSVAWLAVAMLRLVHGASTPRDLEYQAFDRASVHIDLPELGVEGAPRSVGSPARRRHAR